eukprot:CAMPEP_0169179658 /NCGR_PEP_ID=MMETSP1015-20121227/67747_1 /TAXON_ID=342587 /ORGANISM="Karlodinium micrum, Strain CCMP2283" /LENGTH=164 /DNA_ID=CAMNT_0009254699 /DNA_START=35 /DNA_END=529 /DNA_ORIENTATION=+
MQSRRHDLITSQSRRHDLITDASGSLLTDAKGNETAAFNLAGRQVAIRASNYGQFGEEVVIRGVEICTSDIACTIRPSTGMVGLDVLETPGITHDGDLCPTCSGGLADICCEDGALALASQITPDCTALFNSSRVIIPSWLMSILLKRLLRRASVPLEVVANNS